MNARAWFVLCIAPETPDGPGRILGPFPTKELAEDDLAEVGNAQSCGNSHAVTYGPGSPEVQASNSTAWVEAFKHYCAHPGDIPARCRHLFSERVLGGGAS